MNLVIVESPTKARTLSRYLGGGYQVVATYGHVRDLPEKKMGIAIEVKKGEYKFEPEYVVGARQKQRVEEIRNLGNQADKIYLATDPDREGEAIAWHVSQVLSSKGKVLRAQFHEITERAIGQALDNPRQVDMKLVEAQQARRVLDRLVGYKLSPLLWRKVRKGLSAGRVQSVAVRLVVEREREIEAFNPQEFWDIWAELEAEKSKFRAKLETVNGEKLQIVNGEQAKEAEEELRVAEYAVAGVEKKEIKKTPPAPFTTSTLQQTAANRFGWSAKKIMQVAQMLYEQGYITYHRTDSLNMAAEATEAARDFISGSFGPNYALGKPRFYKTKSRVAQEAHEAIRPTEVGRRADSLPADQLNRDQVKLYELIWKRFVACQMAEAKGVSVTVTVTGKTEDKIYGLAARGETITFDGWLRLYNGGGDENGTGRTETLPEVAEGEKLGLVGVESQQKFTQPPARYSDASLIKALEELGIGRPSTYAPILSTIQDRQYVEKLEKRFRPTVLGVAVNDFLVANFSKVVDYGFTAQMEDNLDEVARGERDWQPMVSDFYGPFEQDLERVGHEAARVKIEVETTGEKCPDCGQGEVVVRVGRFGKFLACSRYPDCKYKANYLEKIGVACPTCTSAGTVPAGEVIVRRTKSRKTFYGCSNYPKCKFASWTKPKI